MAESKEAGRKTYATDFITTDVAQLSYLGNPHIDNIMTTLIAMGNEMWASRKRQYILEALLAEKGVTNDQIEKYMPNEKQEAAWTKERKVLVERFWGHHALNTGEFTFTSDWKGK